MSVRLKGGGADGFSAMVGAPYTPDTLNIAWVSGDWRVIGHNRMPPGVPFSATHLLYRLDRAASELAPHPVHEGMEVGEAVYRWVA